MSKKIILAGFACLLLFLVSVAKSDPNKQAPRPVVAVDVAPRPTTTNLRRARKDHQHAPAVQKKVDESSRQ